MIEVIQQFVEGPQTCAYLPWQQSTLAYEVAARLSADEYETRMNQGWRKFGPVLFRPVCHACRACRPLRVDARAFAPARSQRRVLRDNADLRVRVAPPQVDSARLDLYARYHAAQAARKGWPQRSDTSPRQAAHDYAWQFVHNPVPGIEISVWEGEGASRRGSLASTAAEPEVDAREPLPQARLLGVLLADLTPNTLSGVYHFHDPHARERSLGTFLILQSLLLARQTQKSWVYMGYYVEGCASMMYKNRFRPYEILGDDGVWRADTPRSVQE